MPDAVETMAYVGETPWHGKGNKVTPGASPKQMEVEANLTWRVLAPFVEYTLEGQRFTHTDKLLIRSDTKKVLDTVGPKYIPFQNDEILAFFSEYVEAGQMHLDTAGALGGATTIVWALARMDESFSLPGGDKVGGYVLIANPHKYGQGATIKFTPIRVVCYNTLTMALGGSGAALQLSHIKEFNETPRQDAKRRLGIARERFDAFEQDAHKLVATTLNDSDVEDILVTVFPTQEKVRDSVSALYFGGGKGSHLPSAHNTAWGLLNAVTEYYDWHSGRQADTRLRSTWYGGGASKKRLMMATLLGDGTVIDVEGADDE